jgi:hypothetical protein
MFRLGQRVFKDGKRQSIEAISIRVCRHGCGNIKGTSRRVDVVGDAPLGGIVVVGRLPDCVGRWRTGR